MKIKLWEIVNLADAVKFLDEQQTKQVWYGRTRLDFDSIEKISKLMSSIDEYRKKVQIKISEITKTLAETEDNFVVGDDWKKTTEFTPDAQQLWSYLIQEALNTEIIDMKELDGFVISCTDRTYVWPSKFKYFTELLKNDKRLQQLPK